MCYTLEMEKRTNESSESKPSINDVRNEIEVFRASLHPTGAVDEEGSFLNGLAHQLERGEKTPLEVLEALHKKFEGRNHA